ncbi:MAG: ABC transporter ATP-binding protein/permease [Acetatifactor sp.]|nr:ABC transporter ATP-binding protein/permease [Acetatifactor sp.]
MRKILQKLNVLLDKKQKATMVGLIFLMIIGAFLQTAGVGMLVEGVRVVIDPEAVEGSRVAEISYRILGIKDYSAFAIAVMSLLILVFVVKNLFLYVQQKVMLSFVYTNQFRTSERMMRNYLRRGYEFFLNADTAVVQRSITSDVNNMYALILSLLQLMSDGVVSVFIVAFCFAKNVAMTLMMAVVLVGLMLLIKRVLKPIMYRAGKDNQDYYSGLFKWISQTVQGIKDVKIAGKEQYFVEEYKKCGEGYVNAVQKYSLYNQIPKLLIETACVATMMGYMIFQVAIGTSTQNMLDVLTTLAAAAFVLLPCVNRINNQLNSIAYFEPFFMGVSDNLQDEITGEKVDMSFADRVDEKLPVKHEIEMKDITYSYPNTERLIFDHADLKIPVGAAVGIVGTTGAGKSTVVDILLGLLETKTGAVYADGQNVKEHYRSWLKNIGYIPQMIFMLDETIRKNVAFGVPEEEIDEKRIWEVLKEAQLDEFVRSLPEGLDTGSGERGIRLSGGQRQRISIARALYDDPEVLILDEATSALDNDTEAAIMESINSLHGKKTLVIIAHRLQTIEKCDIVYRVEGGKVSVERGCV